MPTPDQLYLLPDALSEMRRQLLDYTKTDGIQRKRVIVYHHNCHDGITALWVALKRWPDAVPYAGRYDDEPNYVDLAGADVVIVDFSWKRPVLETVRKVAASLQVIDHHKTARDDLAGMPGCVFDTERSGAGLTWDTLFPGEPRPPLVNYTEDRDLWRFALPRSREVHAAVNCYPLTIESRSALMNRSIDDLATEGEAVLRYHDKIVASAAKHVRREVIGGVEVPSVACPVIEIVSDLGHTLAKGEPFSATYCDRSDGSRVYSLRSDDNGMDVGEIAKQYGGGGHKHAAGFSRKPVG